jgi:hypothetical protein
MPMTIKVREPGDAFKRQVSEFVPVKKRRPWRDEEEPGEGKSETKLDAGEPHREIQGASSSCAISASMEVVEVQTKSNAKSALEILPAPSREASAEIALELKSTSSPLTDARKAQDEVFGIESKSNVNSASVPVTVPSHKIGAKLASGASALNRSQSSADSALEKKVEIYHKADKIELLNVDLPIHTYAHFDAETASDRGESIVAESSAEMALEVSPKNLVDISAISASDTLRKKSKEGRKSGAEMASEPSKGANSETSANLALGSAFENQSHPSAEMALAKDFEKRELKPQHQNNRFAQNVGLTKSSSASTFQTDIIEPLPGTRKVRATFVFDEALRRIGQSSAGLLYCYLWHQAEEAGSARLRTTYVEMAEATGIGTGFVRKYQFRKDNNISCEVEVFFREMI